MTRPSPRTGLRILAALGGNALLQRGEKPDAYIQHAHIRQAAIALAKLMPGNDLIICHGNGPQVGMLALESESDPNLRTPYPLDVLGAQTQGMIGYWLSQELANACGQRPVLAVVTQTLVDPDDHAFAHPTKFIGPLYSHEAAHRMAVMHNWVVAADGQAWRRVVASPAPRGVVEIESIRGLLDAGTVVVCGGGGGAPVMRTVDGQLIGVDAVVDKDDTAELLARELKADVLLLLTDVDAVMRDFGTDHATPLSRIDASGPDAEPFPAGSMGPKVAACARFVRATGGRAAIGSLGEAARILAGESGTAFGA